MLDRGFIRSVAVWVSFVGLMNGCDSCGGCHDDAIAKLISLKPSVQRDYATDQNAWQKAGVGDSFALNDAVRTRANASAKIELVGNGGIELGPNTVIRFLSKAPGQGSHRLNIETGAVTVDSGGQGVQLNTHVGIAYLNAGSRVSVNAQGDRLRLDVVVGQASIMGKEQIDLQAGQSLVVSVGGAVLERPEQNPPTSEGTTAPAEAPGDGPFVLKVNAKGVRYRPSQDAAWQPLAVGDTEVAAGTHVQIPKRVTLQVNRGSASAAVTGAAAVIVGPEDGSLLRISRGKAKMQAPPEGIRALVPGGSVLAKGGTSGSAAAIDVGSRLSLITTDGGQVDVVGKDAQASLSAGESATLYHNGVIDVTQRIPKVADLTIPAGETATVHDANAPTAIRIRFANQCPADAVVELSTTASFSRPNMSSRGSGGAIILVAPGNNRYRVRCIEGGKPAAKAVAAGTLRVRKDTGAQKLPKRAPSNTVEADGRRYTVMFQNLLPELTFMWPSIEKTRQQYVLVLEAAKGGKVQSHPASGPRVTLPSGKINEGLYRWWFEQVQTKKRSAVTTLQLMFDNAAQAASIQEPVGTLSASSGQVTVSGTAVDGASISVDGVNLGTDAQYRFTGTVALPKDDHSLSIRIAQPQYGVHYYLRSIAR